MILVVDSYLAVLAKNGIALLLCIYESTVIPRIRRWFD